MPKSHVTTVLALATLAVLALANTNAGNATSQIKNGEHSVGEPKYETAIIAGGCFWCVEKDFDRLPGVKETISGYTGGHTDNPTYKAISKGDTGHIEALKVIYDPNVLSYEKLLYSFWRSVDPTDPGGQFCDRGSSYVTAIFALNDEQFKIATISKEKLDATKRLPKPIATEVKRARKFYPAESYHQNYYKKKPLKYGFYRYRCGRDKRVKALWGEEAHAGLKKK